MDVTEKKYGGSIAQTTPVWKNNNNEIAEKPLNYKDNTTLDINDFYTLMAAEMQYQDVLNPESNTSEMMSQMVQMSMINAIQDMMTMSMTSYAGSMMGKEVTLADSSTGKLETITGVVEGVNLYNGNPTIVVNGKEYSLTQIMGIGKQAETSKPETKPDPEDPPVTDDEGGKVEGDGGSTDDEGGKVEGDGGSTDDEGGKVEDNGGGTDNEGGKVEDNGGGTGSEGGKVEDNGGEQNPTDQVTDTTNKDNPNKTGEPDDTNTTKTEDEIKTETVEKDNGEQA